MRAPHNLAGVAAVQQHRVGDARRHNEAELRLRKATGDRMGQAVTYGQLGRIAIDQRRFEEAETRSLPAEPSTSSWEFGDRHSAARAYNQLGRIAQEQRRLEEAEAAYRQALDILLEFGNRHSAARTYHQLGVVAQERRRLEEAEAFYRQALDIFLEFGDRHTAATAYNQPGAVAQGAAAVREEAEASPTGRPWTSSWSSGTGTCRRHLPQSRRGCAGAAAAGGGRGRPPRQALDIFLGVRGPALRRPRLPPAPRRGCESSGGWRRPRPPTGRP